MKVKSMTMKSIRSDHRMNGLDKRLERELEAILIIMEACEGFGSIVRYDVVGHSGEGKNHLFVDAMHPPANAEQRFKVLQVCMTSDFANVHAITNYRIRFL